jgi:hypothetical protein
VLAAVGRNELTVEQAAGFLRQSSDVPATLTAPASGLFLEAVFYDRQSQPGPLQPVGFVPA